MSGLMTPLSGRAGGRSAAGGALLLLHGCASGPAAPMRGDWHTTSEIAWQNDADSDTAIPQIDTHPPTNYVATTGSEMIGVPGGTFLMGNGAGPDPYGARPSDEWLIHEAR